MLVLVVVCKIQACPFCSQSGFCKNRFLVIGENGVCKFVAGPRLNEPIPQFKYDMYRPPQEEEDELAIEEKENG